MILNDACRYWCMMGKHVNMSDERPALAGLMTADVYFCHDLYNLAAHVSDRGETTAPLYPEQYPYY